MKPHYKDVLERNMWALVILTDMEKLEKLLGPEEAKLTRRAMKNSYFEYCENNNILKKGESEDDGTAT